MPKKFDRTDNRLVSILIPARDEENNIEELLNDIVRLNYKKLEVIVYDDNSSDNTLGVVRRFSEKYSFIHFIEGGELPEGWLGKNYACYEMAKVANGDVFLFLDADVEVEKYVIEKALTFMSEFNLKLLSIFPRQVMPSLGSNLAVPLMNWILLSLLPLPLIRMSKQKSLSAANGQFLCFEMDTYRRHQPHRYFKHSEVEDIHISRFYKQNGDKVATILGKCDVSCRMYENLRDAIKGFSKNIFEFFGGSIWVTYLFAVITTFAPFLIYFVLGFNWLILYVLMVILLRIFVSLASSQKVMLNLLLLIPQHIIFWVIIVYSHVMKKRKSISWKGRNIYSS